MNHRSTPEADERALVARMRAGDSLAFEQFFEDHFQRLYRFAMRRLQNPSLAEDVVQTTLVAAIRGIHTWRGEAALFTWLCTICRREILRASPAPQGPRVLSLTDDEPTLRAALETLAGPDTAGLDLHRRELRELVQLVLDALPAHYGRVLELKYLEDHSVNVIAEHLALTPKAVESLLSRARHAFRTGFITVVEARDDVMDSYVS